jgi:hypothetical protein
MARNTPRRRHFVSHRRISLIRPGFRYSPGRDAYVLRFVGNRFGPVYKLELPQAASAEQQVPIEDPQTTQTA